MVMGWVWGGKRNRREEHPLFMLWLLNQSLVYGARLRACGPTGTHNAQCRGAHYGLIKMCRSHLQDAFCDCALDTYTAVPWAHIQPCPGQIYNYALDPFHDRVFDTFKYVSLPYLYMEKDKNIDTFQALTKFSNHSAEEICEDFGNYICNGN